MFQQGWSEPALTRGFDAFRVPASQTRLAFAAHRYALLSHTANRGVGEQGLGYTRTLALRSLRLSTLVAEALCSSRPVDTVCRLDMGSLAIHPRGRYLFNEGERKLLMSPSSGFPCLYTEPMVARELEPNSPGHTTMEFASPDTGTRQEALTAEQKARPVSFPRPLTAGPRT